MSFLDAVDIVNALMGQRGYIYIRDHNGVIHHGWIGKLGADPPWFAYCEHLTPRPFDTGTILQDGFVTCFQCLFRRYA